MTNLSIPNLSALLAAENDEGVMIAIIIAFFCLMAFVIVIYIFAKYFNLWIQSALTGAGVTFFDLIGMTFRRVNPHLIVKTMIMSVQAGLKDPEICSRALEAHFMAGGDVRTVIRALIAAKKAKTIQLTFREATAIDLAGRDVLESVQTSVYPKVIDCPAKASSRSTLDAVAKDGIQLKVKARVTVRANLQQLIGGATEETIVARVGEGLVSAIAAAAEQEEIAAIQESRAFLVAAEAEVPKAMADAFQSGRLGILDYYQMRNVQADTDMRTSIATAGNPQRSN
jgi:uncharacterized protein YqfA (UPF0365 family)